MHTCCMCGKPTPNYREYSPLLADLFSESGYSMCDECRRKGRIQTEWENEQSAERFLICPYCESFIDDPWQYEEDEDEKTTLDICDKSMDYLRRRLVGGGK